MTDVKALFKKKKKGKKALSFKKKLEAAGGVLPGSGSATTENENGSEQNPESSLLASLMSTSKGKDKIVSDEVTEEVKEVADNLEDMNLTEYRQQQEKLKTREEFHKTRKKLLKKESKGVIASVAPTPTPPAKISWRDRVPGANHGNIEKQLLSEASFPTLGGAKVQKKSTGSVWGQTAEDVESDEEIDPVEEEKKRLAAEAARKLEEEKRAVWKPSKEEGGVNTTMDSEVFSRKVNSALDEFLQIEDYKEVGACFKELRNPAKHMEIAMKILEKGMDNVPEDGQIKLAKLLVHMRKTKPYLLTKEQIEGAFTEMESILDDLIVDFPTAKKVFALMQKECQKASVIPGGPKPRFLPAGKFEGAKEGYAYKMGANGMGYYLQDNLSLKKPAPEAAAPNAPHADPFGGARPVKADPFGGARPVKADPFGGAKPVKADPFGGAKPVKADPFGGAKPVKADPFGGAKPVKADPFGGAKPVKADPFGGAKPVKADPFGGARPVKADPFGGARPVKADPFGGARPVKVDPFGGAKPVKVDPFGGAKPVKTADPLAKTNDFPKAKPNPFGDAKPVATKAAEAEEDADPYAALRKKKKKKKSAYDAFE